MLAIRLLWDLWGLDLQGHGVNDELHGQELAVSGDTVGVEVGAGIVVLAVLVDQVPQDLVQHGGPGLADVVDLVLGVEGGVSVGVGGQAGREQDRADTGRVVVDPGTHGVVGVAGVGRLETDGRGHEVTPTLTHTTSLEGVEAVGVGGSTGQTRRQTVGVLVDDDTGLEGAVTVRGGQSPDVHSHAAGLAIGGSGKVGIVSAGAVLGVQDGEVAARTTLAVVVDLEVTGGLVETQGVQEVMVLVTSEEQLGDGGITVGGGGSHRCGPCVLELVLGLSRTVVGQVSVATSGVDLGNSVVAAGGVVGGSSVTEPSECRLGRVPRVGQSDTGALIGIVASPGEDEVAGLSDVVDNTVDSIVGGSVDVCEQPVVEDIGLDSPSEGQGTVLLDVVHQACLGVFLSTRGALEDVSLGSLDGFSGSITSNGQRENASGTRESAGRIDVFTLAQRAVCGDLSGEEVVSVGEDVTILADVDVEVGVVDIEAVNGLLEVDVADTVGANVVVGHTELRLGQDALQQFGGGLYVVATLQDLQRGVGLGGAAGLVLLCGLGSELIQVQSTLAQACLVGIVVRSTVGVGERQSRADDEAGQQRVTHLERSNGGDGDLKERLWQREGNQTAS